MPDLTRGVRRPGEQATVEHEPDTDTLVDPDADQMGGGGLAECELGQRRGVGVVDHVNGQVELRRQLHRQGHVGPAEVGGGDDHALGSDDARAGDADTEQRLLGVAEELPADALDERDRGAAGPALAVVRPAHDDLAIEVDDGADELRRLGHVDAEHVAPVSVDADERGRLADAAGGADPELLDDRFVDQIAHYRRDRRPREPGSLGEIGARERSFTVQGPQQQAAIRPTGVFRRRHPVRLYS